MRYPAPPRLVHPLALAVLAPLLAGAPARANVHQMFVTSETGNGKLSSWPSAGGKVGRAAADQVCQTLAANAHLSNAANFVAWLSTGSSDAFCHVAGFSGTRSADCGQATLPDAGPWVRTDGQPFSYRMKKLTDPSTQRVLYPAFVDEHGTPVAPSLVLTGTGADGSAYQPGGADYQCNDGSGAWRSNSASDSVRVGLTHGGVSWWTSSTGDDCSDTGRLLCFEQGVGDSLPSYARPGAYVFATSVQGTGNLATWSGAGGKTGLQAGDAICQGLAASAGYPNPASFVAWLSVAGQPAIDRVQGGGPWRRPGGVEIAADRAGLVAALGSGALESDVEVDELAQHRSGNVWTGTGADGQPTGDDCNGWTSGASGDSGTDGFRNMASSSWTEANAAGCDLPLNLYCISSLILDFGDGFESGDLTAWDASSPP